MATLLLLGSLVTLFCLVYICMHLNQRGHLIINVIYGLCYSPLIIFFHVPLFLFLCTLGRDVSRVWKTNAIRLLCIGLFFHIRALAQNSPFLKIVFFSRVNMKKIIFVCRNRLLKGMRYHQYTGEQLAMQHQIGTFR